MREYVVQIPIVGYVSLVVEAEDKAAAFEKAFDIASECRFKTDGQEKSLQIEELSPVDDLNNYEPTLSFSSTLVLKK